MKCGSQTLLKSKFTAGSSASSTLGSGGSSYSELVEVLREMEEHEALASWKRIVHYCRKVARHYCRKIAGDYCHKVAGHYCRKVAGTSAAR